MITEQSHVITDAISIHVPTRGTTHRQRRRQRNGKNFNPRSHEGNDVFLCGCYVNGRRFQSTFPRGERLATGSTMANAKLFQSTFPRGERHNMHNTYTHHAHYFNPRSHEGNDYKGINNVDLAQHFNPRSHEGNDYR